MAMPARQRCAAAWVLDVIAEYVNQCWQLQAALDAATDAILVLNNEQRVCVVNQKFADLLSTIPAQLIGLDRELLNQRCQFLLKPPQVLIPNLAINAQAPADELLACKDGRVFERTLSRTSAGDTKAPDTMQTWTFRDVTAKLKADELRTRLAAVVEHSDDAIVSTTLDGFITTWNRSAERLYGYPADKIIGRHVTVLLPYDRHDEEEQILAKLNRGEHVEHYETRRLRSDGQVLDVSLTVSLVRDEQGVVYGTSKIARDISDRKRSEQRLQDRNEWFSSILDSIGDAVIAVDVDGYVSYINRVAQALTGCSADAAQDQRMEAVLMLVDEETDSQAVNPVEMVLRTGEAITSNGAAVLINRDGLRRSVEHSATPIRRATGELLGAVMVFRDISERRRKELELAKGEQRLRLINDVIPQMLWIADAQGNTEYFNERWDAYVGAPRPGNRESPRPAALHPDDHDATMRAWRHSIATGEPFEMEYRLRRFDGEYRWFVARAVPLRNEHGEIESWYGSSTDIHQQKLLVEALQEEYLITEQLNVVGNALASELELKKIVQIITDAGTRICGAEFGAFFNSINDGTPSLMLFTASGLTAGPVNAGVPSNDKLFKALLDSEGIVRSDDIRSDPRYRDKATIAGVLEPAHVVSYLGVPVLARNGEVLGVLMFTHSRAAVFSERDEKILAGVAAQATAAIENAKLYELAQQSAEERKYLLESERAARNAAVRMSEMKDEFLATVSHELRTPLSAIMGWVHVLRRGANKPGDKERALDTIERNGRMQTKLIEDLLDMSRIISGKLRLDIQPVDPLLFIDAALETIRPAADAKGITITTALDPEIKLISADASRLQQVLWNLLSNAVKFTPRDGSVRVVLARTATQIELSVTDSGMGIPAEFLPHVFERFRQADASMTRSVGGLGLGLAIVKQLVELHGGTIEATSPGKDQGSTFTVRLPIAMNSARGMPDLYRSDEHYSDKASDFKPMDLKGVRVVVIDDERDASELVHRILEDCGATVFSTNTASEALRLIEVERPHLFISDIGMPGMDGFELLRQVRLLSADRGGQVPVIALTAFARVEDRLRALNAGFAAHMAKPIEPAELIGLVARIVGQPIAIEAV